MERGLHSGTTLILLVLKGIGEIVLLPYGPGPLLAVIELPTLL